MTARPSRAAVVAAGLLLLWLGFSLGWRPLMLPDEGRYVGVAWEMLHSGDWLTPTLDGLPFFHKPPLFYWITAASLGLFGRHEAAARLAPLLGALLCALPLAALLRRWWGTAAARRALVALAVQPLFFVGGQFANLDMLVAGCIGATIVLAAHAALSVEAGRPARAAVVGAWAMAGAGLLAKGLIGLVIPALVIGGWLLLRRTWRPLRALLWWPGPLACAALALPWFVLAQQRHAGFFEYFFVVQHFRRFAAGGFNNVQPFWFYPAVLALCSLPWWPWLRWRPPAAPAGPAGRGPLRRLMVVWLAVVLVFFSLPQSKLVGYILPAVPPLAALIADGFERTRFARRNARRVWQVSVVASALAGLGVVSALAWRTPNSLRDLGLTLAARRAPGEPVFMLGRYAYDVPFYAGLTAPAAVVDDWREATGPVPDNWHKELSDAARFAPARAHGTLIDDAAFAAALCRAPASWVVGPSSAPARYPFLEAAEIAFSRRDLRLWRILPASAAAGALPCQEPTIAAAR